MYQYHITDTIIDPGVGLECPLRQSICEIIVDSLVDDIAIKKRLEEVCGFKVGEKVEVQLEAGEGDLSDILDVILEKMKAGQKSEFEITFDEAYFSVVAQEKFSFCLKLISFTQSKHLHRLSAEECIEIASNFKLKGTKMFSSSQITKAGSFYSKAIKYIITCLSLPVNEDLKETAHNLKLACHLNLAACQLNKKLYDDVIINCTSALHLRPDSIKALFRRASAYIHIKDYDNAEVDIKLGLKLEPNNKALLTLSTKLKDKTRKSDKQLGNKLSVLFK